MGRALVVVDMLNDFVRPDGKLYFEKARTIIEPVAALLAAARRAGLPVVFDNDAHPPDSREFARWPVHCLRGTAGAQVVDELAPLPGELVLEKDCLSLFSAPGAERALRDRNIDELLLVGTATEYCVMRAALDGLAAGFGAVVVTEAVAGVDLRPGDAAAALAAMDQAGVRLVDLATALDMVGK